MKRLRLSQIQPLEIWNLEVRGRTLFEWQSAETFPQVLLEAVENLRSQHRFEHVHLLGGGALKPSVAESLNATVAEDPLFAAARAGLLLAPACADVGQTSIKLVTKEKAWLRSRTQSLPDVDFITSVLSEISGPCLLALPCALDDGGALSECSYDWGGQEIESLLYKAGLDQEKTLLLNDAELAAVAAMKDPRVPQDRRTLVLTLGYGVGAALLR